MSSSSSEYLRRKMAAKPRYIGPAVYGDASQKTYVLRMSTINPSEPTLTVSTNPSCCTGRPTGGPYNSRNGDGQQQEWSTESLMASRVNLCEPLPGGKLINGCNLINSGCGVAKPAGVYYDAAGIPMTAAYQGAKLKCCGFQATLETTKLVQGSPKCFCGLDHSTRLDTLLANNMPNNEIPFPH
jgi:hypothetical protein